MPPDCRVVKLTAVKMQAFSGEAGRGASVYIFVVKVARESGSAVGSRRRLGEEIGGDCQLWGLTPLEAVQRGWGRV